jgi:hypothetical protein
MPKTEEPVSKMTVKCCVGVPTVMLTKYCDMSPFDMRTPQLVLRPHTLVP